MTPDAAPTQTPSPPRAARLRPGTLAGIRRVVHVDAGGYGCESSAACIADVTAALAARGVDSHLIHADAAHACDSHRPLAGIAERNGPDPSATVKLQARLAELAPDAVCLHNGRDARLVRDLAQPGRPYLLLWYIHDHYPTCLTGLRTTRGDRHSVCRQRLSMSCLIEAERGSCAQRTPGRSYRMPDLFARLNLLESARRVDGVLVPSPFLRETLLASLPEIEHRIHVVPPPVVSRPAAPRAAADPPVVAYDAPIVYEQGLHVTLAALGLLPRGQRLQVRIAGAIADAGYWAHCRERIRALESTHPTIGIEYLGAIDGVRRGTLYDITDILTVPRLRREASERNAAEAMVRGAAVIATRVGVTHEWIRDGQTGLLIPPGDAGALADALARLLADEAWRAELVMAGRWLIGNQFTAHEHVETLAAVIAACRVQRRGPTRWRIHPRPPEPPADYAARAF